MKYTNELRFTKSRSQFSTLVFFFLLFLITLSSFWIIFAILLHFPLKCFLHLASRTPSFFSYFNGLFLIFFIGSSSSPPPLNMGITKNLTLSLVDSLLCSHSLPPQLHSSPGLTTMDNSQIRWLSQSQLPTWHLHLDTQLPTSHLHLDIL